VARRWLKVAACIKHTYRVACIPRVLLPATIAWSALLLLGVAAEPLASRLVTVPITNGVIIAYWSIVLPGSLLIWVATAGIAVGVHRFIILHETPPALRMGRIELVYLRRMLWLGLLAGLGGGAFWLILLLWSYVLGVYTGDVGSTAAQLVVIGLGGYAFFEFLGSTLALPAAAVGRSHFRVRDAWAMSEGNKIAIFVIFLASSAGLIVLSLIITTVSSILVGLPFGRPIGRWIVHVVAALMNAAWISAVFAGLVDGNSDFAESIGDSTFES
jgi:hypothetical protein